jgi:hypothetical protein
LACPFVQFPWWWWSLLLFAVLGVESMVLWMLVNALLLSISMGPCCSLFSGDTEVWTQGLILARWAFYCWCSLLILPFALTLCHAYSVSLEQKTKFSFGSVKLCNLRLLFSVRPMLS